MIATKSRLATILATSSLFAVTAAHAQSGEDMPPPPPIEMPDMTFDGPGNTDWRADQVVGKSFRVTMDDKPEPYTGPSVRNSPVILPRDGRTPNVPEGFRAILYAENLPAPRQILALPNGDTVVAIQNGGYIMMMRDNDGDGTADYTERHAAQFNGPYGLGYRETADGKQLLVVDQDGIWTISYSEGDLRPPFAQPKPAGEVPESEREPGKFMDGQQPLTPSGVWGLIQGHYNRDLAIAPDGTLYVGVGSVGNIGVEPDPKSTVQAISPDGNQRRTLASGMRNPAGLAIQPGSGDLWALVQERDGLGDLIVPDYFTRVQDGGFYGFPYSYIGSNPQPGFAERAPDMVESAIVPDLLFESHSAGMDAVFYDGDQFPAEYRGDAFVALKGSWNRSGPTGYKVVRALFENGEPTGEYVNFMTGFWQDGADVAEVWGRPVDVEVAPDGSLFVIDENGGTVWKVVYEG